jgi:PST family polysaccharide transporter
LNIIIKNLYQKLVNNITLAKNIGYLSMIQVVNILIPLIIYPYLILTLGKEVFGLTVFVQTVISYLIILVNFGFNLSATREISIHRSNTIKLSEIVSSVFIIKGTLFVISLIFLVTLSFIVPHVRLFRSLYFVSMFAVLHEVMFAAWYFQGIEKMKYIAYVNVTSKILQLILIFICIKSQSDFLLVPLVNGLAMIAGGIISLYIIFIKHRIHFAFQTLGTLRYYALDSSSIFISNISTQLYVNANKIFVGSFLGMSEVAVYDLAEKILNLIKLPLSIISQSIYPKISKDLDKEFIKKMFRLVLYINFVILSVSFFIAPFFIDILGGHSLKEAVNIFRILAFTLPIIGMSNFFGVQLLIPFGYRSSFTRVVVLSCLVYCIQFLILYLMDEINIYTITLMTVLTEVYVTFHMYYLCINKKLL